MNKPKIHFDLNKPYNLVINGMGWLFPIDHPNKDFNGRELRTSTISFIHVMNDEINIETKNSLYIGVRYYENTSAN